MLRVAPPNLPPILEAAATMSEEEAPVEVQRMLLASATAPCNENDAMGEIEWTGPKGTEWWQWHREPNGTLYYSKTYRVRKVLAKAMLEKTVDRNALKKFMYVQWHDGSKTWEPYDMLEDDGVVSWADWENAPTRTQLLETFTLKQKIVEMLHWPTGWDPIMPEILADDEESID
jgi:hypothetical protein